MSNSQPGSPFVLTNRLVARYMSRLLKVESILILLGGVIWAIDYNRYSPPHNVGTSYLIAVASFAIASLFAAVGFGVAAICEMHERVVDSSI